MKTFGWVFLSVALLAVTFCAGRAIDQRDAAIAQRDAAIAERDSLRAVKTVTVTKERVTYTFVDAIDSNLTFESWGAARQYARARQRAWQPRSCCCPCCR